MAGKAPKQSSENLTKVSEYLSNVSKFVAETSESVLIDTEEKRKEVAKQGLAVLLDGFKLQIETSDASPELKAQTLTVAEKLVQAMLELVDTPDGEVFGFGEEIIELFTLVNTRIYEKTTYVLEAFAGLLPSLLAVKQYPHTSKDVLAALNEINEWMARINRASMGFKAMTAATYEKSQTAAEDVVRRAAEAL